MWPPKLLCPICEAQGATKAQKTLTAVAFSFSGVTSYVTDRSAHDEVLLSQHSPAL